MDRQMDSRVLDWWEMDSDQLSYLSLSFWRETCQGDTWYHKRVLWAKWWACWWVIAFKTIMRKRFYQSGRNYSINKYKPLQERTFFFTMYEKLWWSPAWQQLTPAAQNLFFAMVSEARFSFDKKKKINPKPKRRS